MRRLVSIAALVTTAALVVGACGGEHPQIAAAEARTIASLDLPAVPGELNGLKVAREDVAETIESVERPYFDGVVLYSLREGDQLQATLQVGRFADDTRYRETSFRSSLLGTIGGGIPKRVRMGEESVWLTSANRQAIAVWFRGPYLFLLSARDEYDYPRTLLRETLKVEP